MPLAAGRGRGGHCRGVAAAAVAAAADFLQLSGSINFFVEEG